jgi:molybdopterin converting factor subunit 1
VLVRVRFFASLRERAHRSEAVWGLAAGATVADLWASICTAHPQLAEVGASVAFAVNREYVDRGHRLREDDEVALIPPVSGG